jgi:hypothetical protein
MSLQLHRPDGKGGLEVRTAPDKDWRKGGKLPGLANPEMNPTSTGRAVAFWAVLGLITFGLIVAGYGSGFWSLVTPGT